MQSYDANRGHSNFFRVFLSELLRHMAGFYDKQKKHLSNLSHQEVFFCIITTGGRCIDGAGLCALGDYWSLLDVTADENNVILQVFFLDEK